MKPIADFDKVQATGDFERLAPGGYVLKITEATDDPKKEYLKIVYDIAEGPEKGRYSDEWAQKNKYAHAFYRSYKEKAVGMFKAFTNALEESNDGYKWSWEEATLKGKLIGAVIAEEEYMNDRGEIKTRLYVNSVMSADRIRKGDYRVPALKLYKEKPSDGMKPAADVSFMEKLSDDDLPF